MANMNGNKDVVPPVKEIKKPKGFGIRHLQSLLLFWGLLLGYTLKTNLSIAIVAMTDNSSNPDFKQFNWHEQTRGILLSSLLWGYALSPVPAGLIAHKFGGKRPLLIAAFVAAVLTLLTPTLASFGWQYICVTRVIQGVMEGCYYPCIHTILARWLPPSERTILAGFTYSGALAGISIMYGISGVIIVSVLGWPGIFYISGGLAVIWSFFFCWLGCNAPADYPSISVEELEYIGVRPRPSRHRDVSTPWKQIFTSKAFLAMFIANGVQSWGFWMLITQTPSYMSAVLNFNIKSNALFSAMPYLAMLICTILVSYVSGVLTNRKILSVGAGRKLFNTIGMWIPAACLIALGYVTEENRIWALVLLTIAGGANATIQVGFLINHMDLAPTFAGTLIGLTHGFGNVLSVCAPLFVGFVVYDLSDPTLWRIVFFLTAALFFGGNMVFIFFGKGTVQKWNNPPSKQTIAANKETQKAARELAKTMNIAV